MRSRPIWVVVLAAGLLAASGARASGDVVELVRKADHALRGQTTAAVIGMVVHTGRYDRSFEMVYWEDTRGGGNRVLIKVLGPALFRGQGTLKVDDRLTLYNPNTDRLSSLSSSMLGEPWMGSHFSNDDLVKETDLARDFVSREVRTWDGPSLEGGTAHFHAIELRPTPRAPVPWDHIDLTLYEDGARVVPTKYDYYAHAGTSITRTLSFSDVKDLGGRRVPTVLTMTVADKPGEYTRVVYESAKFDADIPAQKFTEEALRK